MTCTDTNQRNKFVKAWRFSLTLADRASTGLDALLKKLPEESATNSGNTNTENQRYIAAEDPAYTQMYYALDGRMSQVRDNFDKIRNNVRQPLNTPGAPRANGQGGLRIICDKDGALKDQSGNQYCS